MRWGGHRQGAGRKSGVPNTLTSELREKINVEGLINELQAIIFKNKGRPSVGVKINAIRMLLGKVLPDISREEVTIAPEVKEPSFQITDEQARQMALNTLEEIEGRNKARAELKKKGIIQA